MRRQWRRCYLSLGSNVGNRGQHLRRAIREIKRLARARILRVSRIYESSPVGIATQRDFLNCCVELHTDLSPIGLLVELKRIEAALGRRPGRRWGPRTLDADILLFGSARLRTAYLSIPHPAMKTRLFVLTPLATLYAPAKAWLAGLNDPSQNVKLSKETLPFSLP